MRIDQTNYESFFLSYVDGELSVAEREAVEAYCKGNPDAAREMESLQQTIVSPSPAVFEQKEALYRKEEDRRVIGWYLWRAAAILFLLAGGGVVYQTMRSKDKTDTGAEKTAVLKPTDSETVKSGARSAAAVEQSKSPDSITGKKPVSIAGSGIAPLADSTQKKRSGNESESFAGVTGKKPRSKNGGITADRKPGTLENKSGSAISSEAAGSSIGNARDKGDETGTDGVLRPGNTALAVLPARRKQPGIGTVRIGTGLNGRAIPLPAIDVVQTTIPAKEEKIPARTGVAFTDQPSEAEQGNSTGNDAVSVLRLENSGNPVRKLFRRITSGKDGEGLARNNGTKKVNISIFQFALGK